LTERGKLYLKEKESRVLLKSDLYFERFVSNVVLKYFWIQKGNFCCKSTWPFDSKQERFRFAKTPRSLYERRTIERYIHSFTGLILQRPPVRSFLKTRPFQLLAGKRALCFRKVGLISRITYLSERLRSAQNVRARQRAFMILTPGFFLLYLICHS